MEISEALSSKRKKILLSVQFTKVYSKLYRNPFYHLNERETEPKEEQAFPWVS